MDIPKIDYPTEMNLRFASLFLNMSEGRLRALVREEKIVGTKTDDGWMFKKADLEKYAAQPHPRATGGGKASIAGKAFVVHVTADKLQKVKDALASVGIELEPRYDYAKQRAYQAKRKAEKAAAKPANAVPQAAKVAVPGPGQIK